MSIHINGGGGFLGSEIVRLVSEYDLKATVSDRLPISCPPGIKSVCCDILDKKKLADTILGHRQVIHVAGLAHAFSSSNAPPPPYFLINEIGTRNVVEAALAAGVEHIVLVSSVSVYDKKKHSVLDENTPCNPSNDYARSKLAGETIARQLVQGRRTKLSILRMATIYGEEDPGNVGRLIKLIANGSFVWIGKGTNWKSLVFKQDAAKACLEILMRGGEQVEAFNVSSSPVLMRTIVNSIHSCLKIAPPKWFIPAELARRISGLLSHTPVNSGKVLHSYIEKWLEDDAFDRKKIQRAIGFTPSVSIEEGICREVNWFKKR